MLKQKLFDSRSEDAEKASNMDLLNVETKRH